MAELEDEDYYPNDFDGLDFDNIPALQAPPTSRRTLEVFVPSSAISRNNVPLSVASPVASTRSDSVEVMDPTFLAAVDALETHALEEMSRAGYKAFDSPYGEGTSSLNQVHEYPIQSPELSIMDKKGKKKAEQQEDVHVRAILAEYETELTCPICCDLLVGAQVANPCGHTCCGECGYGWLARNEYEPACAVCRASLCPRNPLLPNFAVENLVRQHLQALARSGRPEWQERGYRTIEWRKRVETWKQQSDARATRKKLKEASRARRRPQRYYEVDDFSYVPPWLIGGDMEDDEPLVMREMPRRATRSRH